MCQSANFYCYQCEAFIETSGDSDDDFEFGACENVDQCLAENFVNITYISYYMDLCEKCSKLKKKRINQIFNKRKGKMQK